MTSPVSHDKATLRAERAWQVRIDDGALPGNVLSALARLLLRAAERRQHQQAGPVALVRTEVTDSQRN